MILVVSMVELGSCGIRSHSMTSTMSPEFATWIDFRDVRQMGTARTVDVVSGVVWMPRWRFS